MFCTHLLKLTQDNLCIQIHMQDSIGGHVYKYDLIMSEKSFSKATKKQTN